VTATRAALACALLGTACGSSGALARPSGLPSAAPDAEDRARTAEVVQAEDLAIGWMAAADPRLAARANAVGSDEAIKHIGLEAVLAEDASAKIVGSSLDLFAFRARARALEEAAKIVATLRSPLPETGPLGSALARPRLERELLERLIGEERARAGDEARLGDAAGDLVRGIVSTWTPPARPQDVQDRDAWVSTHLLEICDSLRESSSHVSEPRTGPPDVDVALYPLERLLAPLQFPRGAAAVAKIRMALDADMRVVPRIRDPNRIAQGVKVHLGVDLNPATLPERLEQLRARLRDLAQRALAHADPDLRPALLARARKLLLVERPCPAVPDSRVRAMSPPPERAAVCGALAALAEEPRAAALVALHDDVLLALAAVVPAPPPRTALLSQPADDQVDELERSARERPVLAVGPALAAEIVYAAKDGADERIAAWRALGEAPLDVVAREVVVVPPAAAIDAPTHPGHPGP
jgi:hypothetical protein